jgi:hypothetical protein
MPRGTRHIETGILRVGRWGYELEMEGGGVWRLDVTRSARRLVGQRVTVEGTRAGFDVLDVTRMRTMVALPIRPSWSARLLASISSKHLP